uniref:Alginate lyase domain-containing protein n=1 Tax=Phaeodactylum tricornutum TaxID=2850 RepID=A0A8J9X2D6_PHATR
MTNRASMTASRFPSTESSDSNPRYGKKALKRGHIGEESWCSSIHARQRSKRGYGVRFREIRNRRLPWRSWLLYSTPLVLFSLFRSIPYPITERAILGSTAIMPLHQTQTPTVASQPFSEQSTSTQNAVKPGIWTEKSAQLTHPTSTPMSMIFMRAVGNALPPRHSPEQTLESLDFVLAHEEKFQNTTTHWFLNRLIDLEVQEQVLRRLRKANETYTILPFDLRVYDKIGYAWERISNDGIHNRAAPGSSQSDIEYTRLRLEEEIQHEKLLYVSNVNGVRRAMLEYGRKHTHAQYILPWDGNCFMTRNAWSAIQSSLSMHPSAKYFSVPMDRVTESNEVLLSDTYKPNPIEEPQIIFHREAQADFNENLRYGRREKLELLTRIGVKGSWDARPWRYSKMENRTLDLNRAADSTGGVPVAGWTERLYSGTSAAETENRMNLRGLLRKRATALLVTELDRRAAQDIHGLQSSTTLFYDEAQMMAQRNRWISGERNTLILELVHSADQAMVAGPWSVMDKLPFGCGISGDCHDYFETSLNFLPNLNASEYDNWLRPIMRRDGQFDTNLSNAGKEKYDGSGMAAMASNTSILALAYSLTENEKYIHKAADNLRHWFISDVTRMKPHLKYSRVERNKDGELFASASGLMEMKDLYFFLDAIKIVEKSGVLSKSECSSLRQWFADYLEWLTNSEQGLSEIAAINHHGLYYDIQVAPLALYVGNVSLAVSRMHRSLSRLQRHVNVKTGALSHELNDTNCELLLSFTLQGWVTMARMSETIGLDYWNQYQSNASKESLLCRAMSFANPYLRRREKCSGDIHDDDITRWWPLLFASSQHCPNLKTGHQSREVSSWIPNKLRNPDLDRFKMPHLYKHSYGIAPFWNLGIRT